MKIQLRPSANKIYCNNESYLIYNSTWFIIYYSIFCTHVTNYNVILSDVVVKHKTLEYYENDIFYKSIDKYVTIKDTSDNINSA